jgi:hypothetical protein
MKELELLELTTGLELLLLELITGLLELLLELTIGLLELLLARPVDEEDEEKTGGGAISKRTVVFAKLAANVDVMRTLLANTV